MNIHTFTSESDWIQTSVRLVQIYFQEQIKIKGGGILAVSGGSTPFVIYKTLAEANLDFKKLDLVQVDERYVPEISLESNWASIADSFKSIQFRKVIRFEYLSTIQASLTKMRGKLPEKLGLTILGMGMDGHFASLFAGGNYWQNHTATTKALITQAPIEYHTRLRLSLSPEYIYQSEQILILIKGQAKYLALQERISNPIGAKAWPLEYLYSHPNLKLFCYLE